MLFLAHVQGEPIGLSVGGVAAVVNKSFFLTVSWSHHDNFVRT